jgi:hypothetical protein
MSDDKTPQQKAAETRKANAEKADRIYDMNEYAKRVRAGHGTMVTFGEGIYRIGKALTKRGYTPEEIAQLDEAQLQCPFELRKAGYK